MTRYTLDILLKETLRSEARGYHKLKKQNGGPGQFAIVDLVVRPLPRGGGFRFVNSVVEGRIPEDFIPSLEKGARQATAKGSLGGFPVVDVEVEVLDGAHHRKDSHGRDFQTAGWMAVQEALRTGSSALLEPFGSLTVSCPRRRSAP
jgi:elongation factor G